MNRLLVSKRVVGAVVSVGLMFSLTGCGSNGNNKGGEKQTAIKPTTPVTPTEAFKTRSIWFDTDSDDLLASKDTAPRWFYYFDGDGKVAVYDVATSTIPIKDLDLADVDGSLEKIKEAAKQGFEQTRQQNIACLQQSDNPYFAESSAELIAALQNATYQEPELTQFTLHVDTDTTGNVTAEEQFQTTVSRPFWYGNTDRAILGRNIRTGRKGNCVSSWDLYGTENKDKNIYIETELERDLLKDSSLYESSSTVTVYDKQVGGYLGLATEVGTDHPGWAFDTPTTDGVKVD